SRRRLPRPVASRGSPGYRGPAPRRRRCPRGGELAKALGCDSAGGSVSLATGAVPAQDAGLVALSRSLVDRLGERLRRAAATEADLRTLDEYRSSFDEAYRSVITTIREKLHKRPSGRPRKTTDSIVAKLKRETIRLSQMQDIAGCRLIVADVREQDRLVDGLKRLFPEHTVIDRRRHPSHGYRAVHVIAEV